MALRSFVNAIFAVILIFGCSLPAIAGDSSIGVAGIKIYPKGNFKIQYMRFENYRIVGYRRGLLKQRKSSMAEEFVILASSQRSDERLYIIGLSFRNQGWCTKNLVCRASGGHLIDFLPPAFENQTAETVFSVRNGGIALFGRTDNVGDEIFSLNEVKEEILLSQDYKWRFVYLDRLTERIPCDESFLNYCRMHSMSKLAASLDGKSVFIYSPNSLLRISVDSGGFKDNAFVVRVDPRTIIEIKSLAIERHDRRVNQCLALSGVEQIECKRMIHLRENDLRYLVDQDLSKIK